MCSEHEIFDFSQDRKVLDDLFIGNGVIILHLYVLHR
jgi:hypothetical protein